MADGRPNSIVLLALVLCLAAYSHGAQQYLGKFLGKLSELHHGVSGEVYAVDARTLHLKDFTYDGEGPAAYFWAGSSRTPGSSGFRVRDENGSGAVLKRYRKKSVTITLPDGKNLNNIKWFSVWCDEFAVNFGDVKIPRNFDYPKPQKIEPMRGVHGISSDNIVIVDAQTLLVPNLSYDGEAPDAKFWVGRGSKPSPQGIRVPDENGKEVPLRKYDRKTVVLTLPGDLTVFDIGHFGIWCEAFTVDFGHVRVPQSLNVPPSLKMLGVSPQKRARAIPLPGETSLNGLLPRSPELVGGHLEVTTYRPPSPLIQHPTLVGGQQSIQAQQLQQQQQIQQQQLQQIQQHQVYIAQHRPVNAGVLYPQQQQQQQQQQYIQQQFPSEVNRGLANPQQQYHVLQQQQPLQYYTPQLLQQQSLINQQQQLIAQRRIDQNVYSQQQQQHPQPNLNQQHPGYQQHVLNEQLAYNQLLNQRRLLEEQQLRERLSKSYNRFDLSSNGAPFG